MSIRSEGAWPVIIGGVVLMVVWWVAYSYFEASAYNRVTGKSVSTWDAMFVPLRVQDDAEE